ncbi:netrin receptor unc5, putative [Pediculus humanus corporis]|uniref:Netrin receptor unc5, putative n=1 Tax=Pediculus humanus subsp. corporis TaxID=121224 RepID=E0VKV9_PEDHC|nr:netrin receptor unc5, putative [Pediculus humanus corporis]EEB14015.1 netrin receptor unc5, putative [Pediculus humanus corporis]
MHMEDPLHPPTIPTGDEDQHSVEPMLLETPQDSYVVKNKPATLKCRAAHALNIYFKCNNVRKTPLTDQHFEFVDPQTGVRYVEANITITRNEVDEFFEKDKFRCVCIAWSSSGQVESQPAIVEVALR